MEVLAAKKRIGFLHPGSKDQFHKAYSAFVRRLSEVFGEERDAKIIDIWVLDDAQGRTLPALAAHLVTLNIDVAVAAGGPDCARALKAATSTVPIVFTTVTDPVKQGLLNNLDAPEGNLTGIAGLTSELDLSRLEILVRLVGPGKNVGVLVNNQRNDFGAQYQVLKDAEAALQVTLVKKEVANVDDIETAFDELKALTGANAIAAVLVTADALFNNHRRDVVKFAKAAPRPIPAIYQWREFAEAGGLMSYGPDISDAYEMAGEYVGEILDGTEVKKLPVSNPDRFDLVINMKVADRDGFKIPASLLTEAELIRRRRKRPCR